MEKDSSDLRRPPLSDKNGLASEVKEEMTVDVRPPLHTFIVFLCMSLGIFQSLPSLQTLDEIATLSTFTVQFFPNILSLQQLCFCRAAIAVFIWTVTLQMVTCRVGWEQMTPYKPQSKLKMVPNLLIGQKTLYPFTSWSWIMLGIYFTLSTYISMDALHLNLNDPVAIDHYNQQHRWLLRAAIAVWCISAPCTLLVAAVIRYVMWPAVIRRGGPHSLNSWRNIWMHNSNVLFALMERCLFSGMPIRFSEWALAPLYGCLYVLFSWNMTRAWNERRHGPQFIYFFLDTTLPGYYCSIALLALLAVLTTFYAIYATTDSILNVATYLLHTIRRVTTGESDTNEFLDFFAHLLVTVLLSSLVMRFRD